MADRFPIAADIPIVVLKMTTNLVQHGVLGVLRSAGRLGIPAHWAHNETAAPAARSRYLTAAHPLPPGRHRRSLGSSISRPSRARSAAARC